MNYKTHLLFAASIGVYLNQPIKSFIILLIGSLLPDIDHPKAKFGQLIRPINYLFTHRGFFHTPLFALILWYFSAPLALGAASHILLDTLTPKGTMPLHPFLRTKLRGFVPTGGLFEFLTQMILILIIGIMFL